jgi:hypothetical protein
MTKCIRRVPSRPIRNGLKQSPFQGHYPEYRRGQSPVQTNRNKGMTVALFRATSSNQGKKQRVGEAIMRTSVGKS